MFEKLCAAAVALVALSPLASAAEPGAAAVPTAVAVLTACWEGRGEVMGKPVTMAVAARPIAQDALLSLDAESSAIADPGDRYVAHLIFGGTGKPPGTAAGDLVGFWGDSFGGAYVALGHGVSRPDGFDIGYAYPDAAFLNRWRLAGDRLTWQIVAVDGKGTEKPFASYALHKAACPRTPVR